MNEVDDKKKAETTVTIKFWAIIAAFAAVAAFLVTTMNTNTGRIVRLETAMESMQMSTTEIKDLIRELRGDVKVYILESDKRNRRFMDANK